LPFGPRDLISGCSKYPHKTLPRVITLFGGSASRRQCFPSCVLTQSQRAQLAIEPCQFGCLPHPPRADLCYQTFVGGHSPAVIVNAIIIDVFDEIVLALLKTGHFLPDTILQSTLDSYSTQQSSCVGLTFLAVRPKRLGFRMHEIATQNVTERDDLPSHKCIQAITLPSRALMHSDESQFPRSLLKGASSVSFNSSLSRGCRTKPNGLANTLFPSTSRARCRSTEYGMI